MGSEISAAVEAKFPAENIPKGKLQAFIRELLPPTLENYQNPEIIYNIVAIVKSQVSYDKDALLQIFAEYFSDPVESKLGETQTQIEYYMSDSNLAQDKFFNEKIRGASEGYISMEYLMKCQKLMKQTTSVQQMVAAIRNSSILEYKDLTFRRTGNSSVPELVAAKKSTVPKELPSLLYKVVTDGDEEVKCTWKDIKTAFSEKHPDIELQYTRFQVNEGTLGINGMTRDELLVDIGELTANGITFRVEKLAGDDLTDFFKKHGSHFDLCRKGKRETVREARHSQHTLGGKSFKNAKKILSYLKSIQNATTNGSEVEPKYVPILLDLLKLHPNWGSKYSEEDTKSFAVDKHPDYSETRCFFVIKQSGDREDFSMHKCLGKLK